MDRIADQVAQVEATVAQLRIDVDAILTAIRDAGDGTISPPHAAYWRRMIDVLTNLVLEADERFRTAAPGPPKLDYPSASPSNTA